MVQSLYFLKPKFQASSHLLWLYSPVCVGPGRKPERWFSHETAHLLMFQFGFLAHLSRRLTGELIGYPWIRRPSVVRPSTFSNIFSSETAWPINAKFYVEPPWEGGTKVYITGPGHMTKMAATPLYGKNPSKIFSRTGGPIFTKLGM